jgi:hypothetical protein
MYVATEWVGWSDRADISLTVHRRAILKIVKSTCNGIIVVYLTSSCVNWVFFARVGQFKTRVKRAF